MVWTLSNVGFICRIAYHPALNFFQEMNRLFSDAPRHFSYWPGLAWTGSPIRDRGGWWGWWRGVFLGARRDWPAGVPDFICLIGVIILIGLG